MKPSGMNIHGFDEHGIVDSKTLWETNSRRRAARTIEEQEQREREKDFDAIWLRCWYHYSEIVGKKERKNGKKVWDWDYASLLYNFFLRKAKGLTRLRFRISDMTIRGRKMENNDLVLLARLGDKDNLTEARKTLVSMRLVAFGPWESNKTDYTVTLLEPPVRRGRRRKVSAATIEHGSVSAVDPALNWRDHTAEIDERILDELDS
jgi:hypothetical protein